MTSTIKCIGTDFNGITSLKYTKYKLFEINIADITCVDFGYMPKLYTSKSVNDDFTYVSLLASTFWQKRTIKKAIRKSKDFIRISRYVYVRKGSPYITHLTYRCYYRNMIPAINVMTATLFNKPCLFDMVTLEHPRYSIEKLSAKLHIPIYNDNIY